MDLSELIQKFTSDPAAAKAAAELAAKLMESAGQNARPPEAAEAAQPAPEPSPPAGDMLSSVLSDPAFLAKMPQMLSAIAPMLQNVGTQPASAPTAALPSSPVNTSEQAKRNALLLALKPYLSHERAEAVDHIIRLTGLIELFSLMK